MKTKFIFFILTIFINFSAAQYMQYQYLDYMVDKLIPFGPVTKKQFQGMSYENYPVRWSYLHNYANKIILKIIPATGLGALDATVTETQITEAINVWNAIGNADKQPFVINASADENVAVEIEVTNNPDVFDGLDYCAQGIVHKAIEYKNIHQD